MSDDEAKIREAIGDEIRAILRAHKLDRTAAVYQIGELAERLGSTRPPSEIPEWEPPLPCDECDVVGGHKAWCGT